MRVLGIIVAAALLVSACTGATDLLSSDSVPPDAEEIIPDHTVEDASVEVEQPDTAETIPEELLFDVEVEHDSGQECAPGEGCFLDPCVGNEQCQSGWCVDHMGEGVCSQFCQEECPPGWACKAVDSGGPDLVSVCVSGHANLCRPCSVGADCKSIGGSEDFCLEYADEGSFCGGACAFDDDCPWGFSCVEATTVDGVSVLQCIADAGVCPCTVKSVELALWTPCEYNNGDRKSVV